jgi:hypothetical protein
LVIFIGSSRCTDSSTPSKQNRNKKASGQLQISSLTNMNDLPLSGGSFLSLQDEAQAAGPLSGAPPPHKP